MIRWILLYIITLSSLYAQVTYTEDFTGNTYNHNYFTMDSSGGYYISSERINGTYGYGSPDQYNYAGNRFRTKYPSTHTSWFDIRGRIWKESDSGNRSIFVGIWNSTDDYAGIAVDHAEPNGKVTLIIRKNGSYIYNEDLGLGVSDSSNLCRIVYNRTYLTAYYWDSGAWQQLLTPQEVDYDTLRFYPSMTGGIYNPSGGSTVHGDDFYANYTPTNTDTFSFISPSSVSMHEGGDTVSLSWYSTQDSIRLYLYDDSLDVSGSSYDYILPDTNNINYYISAKPINTSDVYAPFITDSIRLYLFKEDGGYLKIDTAYQRNDSLICEASTINVSGMAFHILQRNNKWYRMGSKDITVTGGVDATVFKYPLKDHSPICKCASVDGQSDPIGGGGSDEEGQVNGEPPFNSGYWDPIADTTYEIGNLILHVYGAYTADPVYGVHCHTWEGTPWDLTYHVDKSCGWNPSGDSVLIALGIKYEGTGTANITNIGLSPTVVKTSTKSLTYGDIEESSTSYSVTSGAFEYFIDGYNLTLTSTATGQSRYFDLKSLGTNLNAAFLGGSGAIHPPFNIKVEKINGQMTLWIGSSSPAVALFYIFTIDANFSFTVTEYNESRSENYINLHSRYDFEDGVNTSKTYFRGIDPQIKKH